MGLKTNSSCHLKGHKKWAHVQIGGGGLELEGEAEDGV